MQCFVRYKDTARDLWILIFFWADTFTHPPSKLLQQILSTKNFNDVAVMLIILLSRLWISSHSTSKPWFFVSSLVIQPCILPLCKNIKRPICDIPCSFWKHCCSFFEHYLMYGLEGKWNFWRHDVEARVLSRDSGDYLKVKAGSKIILR